MTRGRVKLELLPASAEVTAKDGLDLQFATNITLFDMKFFSPSLKISFVTYFESFIFDVLGSRVGDAGGATAA